MSLVMTLSMAALFGCSHSPFSKSDVSSAQELSPQGPTVVSVTKNPDVVALNQNFSSQQPAEIFAEVKDFSGNVQDVKLRFLHAPLEIPMKNVGGTTWRAQLSQQQLKQLAVGGQTMNYEANVIARDDKGMIAVSKEPLTVAIQAPSPSQQRKKTA